MEDVAPTSNSPFPKKSSMTVRGVRPFFTSKLDLIISSCQTPEHIEVACRYVELWFKRTSMVRESREAFFKLSLRAKQISSQGAV